MKNSCILHISYIAFGIPFDVKELNINDLTVKPNDLEVVNINHFEMEKKEIHLPVGNVLRITASRM